ncbi:uncharacterized protein LOC134823433 [Bolinopsis microptera]
MSDNLPEVTTYKKISCNFPRIPEEVLNKMSNDSVLMYKYCIAIDTGRPFRFVNGKIDRFVNNKIGNCSTARWITLGTRILRLYMTSSSYNSHCAEILERMANFIVHVYYKVFANIKLKPKLTDAAVHIFDEIRLARENCQPEEKKIVYESIQQNAFMAHPESVILAMLADEKGVIRQRGISIVKYIRASEAYDRYIETESGSRLPKKIRQYISPQINFDCKSFIDMFVSVYQVVKKPEIPLDSQGRFLPLRHADRSVSMMKPPKRLMFKTKLGSWEPITAPPLIRQLSSVELDDIINTPLSCSIPCHTQSVEHTVALVTGSTKRYRSEDTQLANMLQTAAARKNLSGRVTHKRFCMDPDPSN